jgi:hypothetical protein
MWNSFGVIDSPAAAGDHRRNDSAWLGKPRPIDCATAIERVSHTSGQSVELVDVERGQRAQSLGDVTRAKI